MAGEAEFLRTLAEEGGSRGTVSLVAKHARADGDRSMHEFGVREAVLVALVAEAHGVGDQEVLVFGAVRVVAGEAEAIAHGGVHLVVMGEIVATEAEFFLVCDEEELVLIGVALEVARAAVGGGGAVHDAAVPDFDVALVGAGFGGFDGAVLGGELRLCGHEQATCEEGGEARTREPDVSCEFWAWGHAGRCAYGVPGFGIGVVRRLRVVPAI